MTSGKVPFSIFQNLQLVARDVYNTGPIKTQQQRSRPKRGETSFFNRQIFCIYINIVVTVIILQYVSICTLPIISILE
jgi:hypothetical protein